MDAATPLLYLRTIRRLAPGQVLGRPLRPVVRGVLPAVVRPARYGTDGEDLRAVRERLHQLAPVVAGPPGDGAVDRHLRVAEEVAGGTFRHLSKAVALGDPDWTARPVSRLWTYHLHYFDFAESLARAFGATGEERYLDTLKRLVSGWIEGTTAFRGDAWDPYPTAIRIDRWIRSLVLLGDDAGAEFLARCAASLDRQARYLSRFLERHLRGNHLMKDYKALTLAGLVLPGSTGRRLLRVGVGGLEREAERQVLPDGVHYERSPMYHAIVLEDLLHAIVGLESCETAAGPALRDVAARMLAASPALARPDGTWHQFGDTADGQAPSVAELTRLARHVGVTAAGPAGEEIALPDSGFYGWMPVGGRTKFLIRCGSNAPAEQPGHAHCDLLSFELWLDGRPVAVDTGVRDYEPGPVRHYARSTGAHNTVRLGELEQSEIWGAFRVGRQAWAKVDEALTTPDGGYVFSGECTHYHSSAPHRRVVRGSRGRWAVIDRLHPEWSGPVSSALHLHPRLRVVDADTESIELRTDEGTVRVRIVPFGVDRFEARRGGEGRARGVWFPAFGKEQPSVCVEMTLSRNRGREFGYEITTRGDD